MSTPTDGITHMDCAKDVIRKDFICKEKLKLINRSQLIDYNTANESNNLIKCPYLFMVNNNNNFIIGRLKSILK